MVFLTVVQLAKKAKSKKILVLMESTVSGHKLNVVRERLADKLEFMSFDPYIEAKALYRERKRIRSIR